MLTLVALAFLLQTEPAELPGRTPEEKKPAETRAAEVAPTVSLEPTSVTSIVRPAAIAPELAAKLEDEVRKALSANGVTVQPGEDTRRYLGARDAAQCAANAACYSLLATLSRTPVMVIVEASSIQQDLAVVLQAVGANDGAMLAEESMVAPATALDVGLGAQLEGFSKRVSEAARVAKPVFVADAPVMPKLEPIEQKPVLIAPAPAPAKNPTPAIITGIGAVAAAAVSIVFTANGFAALSCLNGPRVDGNPTVCVSRDRANSLRADVNRDFAVGGGAGGVALALGAASVYLLTR